MTNILRTLTICGTGLKAHAVPEKLEGELIKSEQ
jgi:hypothetical protein